MGRPRIYNPTPLHVNEVRRQPREDRLVRVLDAEPGGNATVQTVQVDRPGGHQFRAASGGRTSRMSAATLATWPVVCEADTATFPADNATQAPPA